MDLVNGAKLAAADLNAAKYKAAGKSVRIEIVAVDDKANAEEAQESRAGFGRPEGYFRDRRSELRRHRSHHPGLPGRQRAAAVHLLCGELTRLGRGNAFRLIGSDELQARAIATFAGENLKATKVAVVYEDTAFGTPLANGATAALAKTGKQVALSEAVDNKTTSFAAFVAKLKAARPEVLIAALRDNQLLPLFEQMNAAGLGDLPVVAASVARTQRLVSGNTVKTLYVTSSSAEVNEFTGGAEFVRKFRAAYNSDPVWAAHYAYDAVFVLADTIRRIDSVDAPALRAKLKVVDAIAPVTTTMRFNAEGEQRYGAIGVYQKENSQWKPLMRSDRW